VQSQASDVDRYLVEVPPARRETLRELRKLCVAELEGYEESMQYGMPSYGRDGTIEVAFASQKNYISFYILNAAVLDRFRPALQGLNLGKGCIRYAKTEQIDFELVKKILADTASSEAEIC
jgi:uncharacterized protein YdhG (YjbR/CyaY superfamily)